MILGNASPVFRIDRNGGECDTYAIPSSGGGGVFFGRDCTALDRSENRAIKLAPPCNRDNLRVEGVPEPSSQQMNLHPRWIRESMSAAGLTDRGHPPARHLRESDHCIYLTKRLQSDRTRLCSIEPGRCRSRRSCAAIKMPVCGAESRKMKRLARESVNCSHQNECVTWVVFAGDRGWA